MKFEGVLNSFTLIISNLKSDQSTPMIDQNNPKSNDTLYLQNEDIGTWNILNGKIRLFTAKLLNTQNGNEFGLLHRPQSINC